MANSFADLDRMGRKNVAGKIVLFNMAFDQQKAANGYAGEAYEEAVAYRGRWGREGRPNWVPRARWSGPLEGPTIVCRTPAEAVRPTFQRER